MKFTQGFAMELQFEGKKKLVGKYTAGRSILLTAADLLSDGPPSLRKLHFTTKSDGWKKTCCTSMNEVFCLYSVITEDHDILSFFLRNQALSSCQVSFVRRLFFIYIHVLYTVYVYIQYVYIYTHIYVCTIYVYIQYVYTRVCVFASSHPLPPN